MKRHRAHKPTRRMTPTERRNERIKRSFHGVKVEGAHDRPNRQDWAESRKRAGWSPRLVDNAIGAASLEKVRRVAAGFDERPEKCVCRYDAGGKRVYTCRWCGALEALPIVDAGRAVEVVLPRRTSVDGAS